MFVYLNRDWDETWGGHLELYSHNLTEVFTRISPIGGRMAIFTNGPEHFHGHSEPLACPEHRSRRSLALYYYHALPHSTKALRNGAMPSAGVPAAHRQCADELFCRKVIASEELNSLDVTNWRRCARDAYDCDSELFSASGDIFMFGVFLGASVLEIAGLFPGRKIFAFDSFTGLPDDAADDGHPYWDRGNFNSTEAGGMAATKLMERLKIQVGRQNDLHFVQGYFNESLTPMLRQELSMRPALYVDIDVDIYSSSIQALDWLFANGLIVVGTMIGYDDWWSVACHLKETTAVKSDFEQFGEMRAHTEITRKYGVRFDCVCGSCALPENQREGSMWNRTCGTHHLWGAVFIIRAIFDWENYSTGFMGPRDQYEWASHNARCRWLKQQQRQK